MDDESWWAVGTSNFHVAAEPACTHEQPATSAYTDSATADVTRAEGKSAKDSSADVAAADVDTATATTDGAAAVYST